MLLPLLHSLLDRSEWEERAYVRSSEWERGRARIPVRASAERRPQFDESK